MNNPSTFGESTVHASLAACAAALCSAQNIVLMSHVNGDGDSIGSTLGVYHLLTQLGKTVRMLHPTPVPDNFRFLQGSEHIQTFDAAHPAHAQALAQADVLVVLDANAPSRMRGMEQAIISSPAQKLVIDHHQHPQPFADVYAVDVEACSTCEMIVRLVRIVGDEHFSKPLAEAVYTGIMTDTGNFRFPRTDAEVHCMIAQLLEAGADPTFIAEQVLNQNPFQRSLLLGRALCGLQRFLDGALCMMTVSQAMMQETNTTEDHIEGFVEQTLSIQGVQIGVLVVELPHQVKISLRSKGSVAVNGIAAHFGGGGHLNAAGCRTDQYSFAELPMVIVELAKHVL